MPSTRTGRVDAPQIDAGARDKYIEVQCLNEEADDRDEEGMPVEDWTTVTPLRMWASKNDVVGFERFGEGQISGPYEARWGLEYRRDMDPDLLNVVKTRRIVYQNRLHDIQDANVVGNYEGIEVRTLSRRG